VANKQQREAYKNNKELLEAEEKAARFFKAQWEKMHYMIECEKIMPAYTELVKVKYPNTSVVEENQADANTEE
jgi:hypothetical protein